MSEQTAQTLSEFLVSTTVEDITEEVSLPGRLQNFKFKIRPISGNEFAEYQKLTSKIGKKGRVQFDSKKFNELLVLNHTIEPNFRSAELIKQAGCQTPEQLLYSRLLAGEISELANQISVLSGFDRDMDDFVDEVKNS